MRHIRSAAICGVLLGLMIGCGKSPTQGLSAKKSPNNGRSANKQSTPAKLTGPAAAVGNFLEAVRSGNDEKVAQMLSTVAREKSAALNHSLTPPASDTASFKIGKVELIGKDGARVASSWTDMDEYGEPRTDEALWIVRLEPKGWRIAGVGVRIFPNEPLLLLNFEEPEEIVKKLNWAREETIRRMNGDQASEVQAQGNKNPENPIKR